MIDAPHWSRRRRASRRWVPTSIAMLLTLSASSIVVGGAGPAQALAGDDWLGIVNTYRAMSNLGPVSANATWSSQGESHSCYMLQNGISHTETPGNPGYTSGGAQAGSNGNVAVSSSISANARNHIDLWMTGPFHAIGILRHNLTASGFGLCTDSTTPTPWHSAGTLDVLRGLDYNRTRPSTPIVFPGNGATVPLYSFITESPDPMAMCGWSGNAGLPLIAMMPSDFTSASASITGPSGSIDTCVLHEGNTSGTAQSILGGDNAVVVMPRTVLADGLYSASVNTSGGNVTWTFTVDRDAELTSQPAEPPPTPDTEPTADPSQFEPVDPFRLVDSRENQGTSRLRAGRVTRIRVGGSDIAAVSANFVAVAPEDSGYITAYNCTADRPTVATLNYLTGRTVANQALVPLSNGEMCLYSRSATDIVIDVNGYYRTTGGTGFVPITPRRLFDSRLERSLVGGREVSLQVAGASDGAPGDAAGVALNVAAIGSARAGHLQVYPCDATSGAEISSINYSAGEVRPNAVVVPVDDRGRICMTSLRNVDVTVDITGYFSESAGYTFQSLDPVRLFDSRSTFTQLNESTSGGRVRAGQVLRLRIAGVRGVPAGAKAASLNVAATSATGSTYLTAYPCGARPDTSNVNIAPSQIATSNSVMVKLSSGGDLCIFSIRDVHVVVDINGVWL